jgi:uncharacterized protein (TIGR02271 family)
MRFISMSKRLVGFLLVLSAIALVAGCHSTKSEPTWYSQSSMGATTGTTSSESATQFPPASSSETTQGQVSVPLYEEQLIVGTRAVESGGVRLRKEVTTETVNQPVQIRRETLVVDREAASGGQAISSEQTGKQSGSLSTPFEAGELVIRLHSEEPVIEKRIVPAGRIIVQTRTNTEQMNVQREVRKEKVDVQKMGDGQNIIVSEKVGGQTSEAVGAAPAEQQETKGKAEQQEIKGKQSKPDERVPVTTEENPGFPRPQPDGHETFPNLNKNPERP